MSKFYTDKAPTPVFAVTFVSNREGIIPPKKVNETPSNNKTTVNPEDIINDKYRYATGQKEKETELINLIKDFKNNLLPKIKGDENTKYTENVLIDSFLDQEEAQEFRKFRNKSLNDLRQDLIDFRKRNLKGFFNNINDNNIATIPTKDSEYLIYSNFTNPRPNFLLQFLYFYFFLKNCHNKSICSK